MDGPSSSGNTGIGSHPAEADAAEGHTGQVEGPGSSGNAGIGSHLAAAGAAEGHIGQVEGSGSSEFAKNGSHLAGAGFMRVIVRWCSARRRGPEPDGILHNHQRKQISWVPFDHNMLLHIHAPVSAKIHIFAKTISKNEYCKNI